MKTAVKSAVAPAALACVLGCSGGEPVDLGEGKTGERLEHYVGSWDGYAEAYYFEADSDRLRLTINADGSGRLEVGDQPPLAPAQDPDVGYPEGWGIVEYAHAGPFIPGFGYPLHETQVDQRRIRFLLDRHEIFADWCGMQTPVLYDDEDPDGGYACLPSVGHGGTKAECYIVPEPDVEVQVDCGWFTLCGGVCTNCTESACEASTMLDSSFDAALENAGEDLVGTFLLEGERVTVRLQRAPP